ncbi:MAG TPA: amidohydrolase family protein [Syntrophales bacterium]
MKRMAGLALIVLLGLTRLSLGQTRPLAITGVKIIDGTGGAPIPDGIVIIEAGRITKVGTRAAVTIPAGTGVLEAAGKFLLPGLIDAHVHLEEVGLSDVGELPAGWDSPERLKELALINARLDLLGGVTTVRDLGSSDLVLRIRDEINAARIIGPRIIASGMQLVKKASGATKTRMFLEFDGPDDGRAKVRQLASMGVDLIKIRLTHQRPVPSLEEVRAIVSEAHRLGLRATVHTDVPADDLVRVAVQADADGIEHNAPLRLKDDALLAEMAKKGMTLMAGSGEFYVQRFEDSRLGEPIGAAALRLFPEIVVSALRRGSETLREQTAGMKTSGWNPEQVRARFIGETARARKAGILFVFGTDAGAYMAIHGDEYKALYGETRMGSTPMEALLMATRDAATALGLEKDIGTVEAGKLADLVIVDADPLTDMRNLHKLFRVIKGGVVYDPSEL